MNVNEIIRELANTLNSRNERSFSHYTSERKAQRAKRSHRTDNRRGLDSEGLESEHPVVERADWADPSPACRYQPHALRKKDDAAGTANKRAVRALQTPHGMQSAKNHISPDRRRDAEIRRLVMDTLILPDNACICLDTGYCLPQGKPKSGRVLKAPREMLLCLPHLAGVFMA